VYGGGVVAEAAVMGAVPVDEVADDVRSGGGGPGKSPGSCPRGEDGELAEAFCKP